MKETGIIMSTEMVKAILDGRKTQTRRVIKKPPLLLPDNPIPELVELRKELAVKWCPYGQVGDRLWVRETFCDGCPDGQGVCYKAYREKQPAADFCEIKWRPSIFMPRWAPRITLENGQRMEVLKAPAHTADDYNLRWSRVAPKWSGHIILPDDLIWHWDWDFRMLS